jgi:hypothetical protein
MLDPTVTNWFDDPAKEREAGGAELIGDGYSARPPVAIRVAICTVNATGAESLAQGAA